MGPPHGSNSWSKRFFCFSILAHKMFQKGIWLIKKASNFLFNHSKVAWLEACDFRWFAPCEMLPFSHHLTIFVFLVASRWLRERSWTNIQGSMQCRDLRSDILSSIATISQYPFQWNNPVTRPHFHETYFSSKTVELDHLGKKVEYLRVLQVRL